MITNLLRQLKQNINIATGKITPVKPTIKRNYDWYGSDYGGFYVCGDKLNSESVIYSFGIGEDITFDRAIIEKHKCKVFGFDPTPKAIKWVNSQQLPAGFVFNDYGIELETGFVSFHLPKNKEHVSGSVISHKNVDHDEVVSVPMKKFSDITRELGHDRISVLKMDIEGSEYRVCKDLLSSSVQIDQIVIELHERFFTDGKQKTESLLKSFHDHGYEVYAVSDSFEEISFMKAGNNKV